MHGIVKALVACIICCTIPAFAWAEASCAVTNRIATQNYPGEKAIHTSNNLILPAGKALEAEGNKLIIRGRIRDKQCMPIPDALVELWQNNPFGRWQLPTDSDYATPNPLFTGTGKTFTDGDGRFVFVTAFPAALKDRAPFINLRIKVDGEKSYDSAFFFGDDTRNDRDNVYKKLSAAAREDVTLDMWQNASGQLIGEVEIVLPTKAPYRTY